MNKEKYLLTVLNEELLEIQTAIESGLLDTDLKNKEIEYEINDFIAVWQILEEKGVLNPLKSPMSKKVSFNVDPEKEIKESCRAMQYFLFKAVRFGLGDIHPKLHETNRSLLENNANMLIYIIKFHARQFRLWNNNELQAKKDKVNKWMKYSKEKSILMDEPNLKVCNNCEFYKIHETKTTIGFCKNSDSPVEWIGSSRSEGKQCERFGCSEWKINKNNIGLNII